MPLRRITAKVRFPVVDGAVGLSVIQTQFFGGWAETPCEQRFLSPESWHPMTADFRKTLRSMGESGTVNSAG